MPELMTCIIGTSEDEIEQSIESDEGTNGRYLCQGARCCGQQRQQIGERR